MVVENLYLKMKEDGKYIPKVMVNSWSDVNIRQDLVKGIEHYFLRLRSPWDSTCKLYNSLAYSLEFFKTSGKLAKFIKSENITVINVHYCSLYALTVVLMKLLKKYKGKLILSFHGTDLLKAKTGCKIEKFLWKIICKNTDKIVTCSKSLKEELISFQEVHDDKAVVINNGIDESLFSSDNVKSLEINDENDKYLLNVATMDHIKGQDILLTAFREIAEEFPGISLVIIGRHGGAENTIKQMLEKYNLTNRVRLFDGLSHAQVLAYMKRAAIFVLPSRYESFGIVILEAGAFGVPVIASDVGGIREIIVQNATGRLCPPEDAIKLANEMRHLLANKQERQRLGGNLKRHVYNNYTWEKTYHKYLDMLSEC